MTRRYRPVWPNVYDRRLPGVDPSIALWNDSLSNNITYGELHSGIPIGQVLEKADLLRTLERLPHGLQTPVGEGGSCISGGEGQRVRFARALRRDEARLVLLDEPFRGLEHEVRQTLLGTARKHWSQSTLLCVTHDTETSLSFDRVIVIEGGRVQEVGNPKDLARDPASTYSGLLRSSEEARAAVWGNEHWRTITLSGASSTIGL